MSERQEILEIQKKYAHKRIMRGYEARRNRFRLALAGIAILFAIFVLAYVNG